MHAPASSNPALHPQSKAWPVAALLLGNVALAFGPWFVRLSDVGPVAAAFWRLALAVPVLLGVAIATSGGSIAAQARGLWGVLVLSGFAFAADLGAWHAGIHHTQLANATLFGNAATFIFPIYGFVVARAWPSRTQGVALGMAAVGAALLMGRSAQLSADNLLGDLLCLLAGVLYALYFILMARARVTMAPVPALALSSLMGVLPLLAGALLLGERVLPGNWWPLVALAVVSQLIGQGLMIYALGQLSPLIIGLALLVQPVVAATIGWIGYGERLGPLDFTGAALVAAALVLVRRGAVASGAAAPQKEA
ncbi:EamA-like transporter family protein [Sphingomonas guangdongensis]|uniref:EamA-like transporter family protein n=1 Tax=Sphingomonas guangdongensis TaxID=1141890 RepID=A0A285QJL0_9SPHN|nr:DMT family transporter [Sphingomonas guangdongensis]SOB80262.1 EamA-like transporter family protein [Sphingomonas guangdongensis]